MKLFLHLLVLFFLFTLPSFAVSYDVTLAGDSSANGCYIDTGTTYNSVSVYSNGTNVLYTWYNSGHSTPTYWFISSGSPGSELADGISSPTYYNPTTSGITGDWSSTGGNNSRTSPAPTVTLSSCGDIGSSTSTATTTALIGSLGFTNALLSIICMFLTLFALMFLTKKGKTFD